MKTKLTLITVISFVFASVSVGQTVRKSENYVTEIVTGKLSKEDGSLKITEQFKQNQNFELDYEEQFFLNDSKARFS